MLEERTVKEARNFVAVLEQNLKAFETFHISDNSLFQQATRKFSIKLGKAIKVSTRRILNGQKTF